MVDRRRFLHQTAAVALAPTLLTSKTFASARRAELLIRGGLVYDGTGSPAVRVDVRVSGDRIAQVGRGLPVSGAQVIDARNQAVAPGFIDIHAHTDTVLLGWPDAESKVRQGVTTEIAGQDGSSVAPSASDRIERIREQYRADGMDVDVTTLGSFYRALSARGAAVNLASMVGAGTIRGLVIGNVDRAPSPTELQQMIDHVRQAVRDGACGLSSGLEYVPGGFATRDELAELARPLSGTGLPYASHMRNEDDSLLASVEEALFVGRVADVPVQISHLKAQGQRNWWKADPVLRALEMARAAGIDVHYDRYPYIAYSTGLSNLFPLWSRDGGTPAFLGRLRDPAVSPRIEAAVRDKVAQLGSWDAVQITSTSNDALAWARGRRLGQLAGERNVEPYALLLEITFADENRTGMVGFGMSEENTEKILAHPLGMISSDGSALAVSGPLARGTPHPRSFGTFARVLGHYVRERKVMPLEKAIHKMTLMPATKLKLAGRGRITPGAFADLVVFDPGSVSDRATFEEPFQYAVGFSWVVVNGVPVIRDGEHTHEKPGRVLVPS
jgi:N-acyl-D-amino-acid deacylase